MTFDLCSIAFWISYYFLHVAMGTHDSMSLCICYCYEHSFLSAEGTNTASFLPSCTDIWFLWSQTLFWDEGSMNGRDGIYQIPIELSIVVEYSLHTWGQMPEENKEYKHLKMNTKSNNICMGPRTAVVSYHMHAGELCRTSLSLPVFQYHYSI